MSTKLATRKGLIYKQYSLVNIIFTSG